MAIEESKVIDLIAAYKKYEQKCWESNDLIDKGRAGLYSVVIEDLESLLPRKTIADLGVTDYGDLTGTIVEHGGRRGVLLEGEGQTVALFTFANKTLIYSSPDDVYPLDEGRFWDETGIILR